MLIKSNKKELDERKYYTRLGLFLTVSATFAIYCISTLISGNTLGSIGSMLVVALLLAFFISYVLRMRESIKKGLPLDDERSRNVIQKAASTSYYVTLYIVLFASWFIEEYPSIRPSLVTNLTVAAMAAVFGISYLIINRRA
jgi:hypothetical protein